MKRPRLRDVKALADYRLKISFINDQTVVIDKREAVFSKPGLAPLRDPEAFAKATIIPDEGWTVTWPELDSQIGADTLWLDALEQSAMDENTRSFLAWRGKHGLSLKEAANALGLTPRTISAYGTGSRPVPRTIVLACKGWEAEQQR